MRSDQAVSTVVGAILILGVLVGAITVFQLEVVPGLKEDAESEHASTAHRSMADLDTHLLRELSDVSHAPSSTSVPLQPDQPPFVPESSQTSTVSFSAETGETAISSPSLKVVQRNGSTLLSGGSGDETPWQNVQNGETISNISEVIGLRIKLTDADPDDGDSLTIEATDANGDYAGDIQVRADINQPDLDLIVQTREPPSPGTVIFHNHIISIHQERWDSDYWIDALLDLYWFELQLENAEKPIDLTFQTGGFDAEYKISYSERSSSGLSTVVGAGETIADYSRSFPTGTLSYDLQNEFYVDQTLDIEHGSLLVRQADGSAFMVDPPLSVEADSERAQINLDVLSLIGDSGQVSGSNLATVRTNTQTHQSLQAAAGELTFTWDTNAPERWQDWLEDELTDAGLTSSNCPPQSADSACQFETQTTSGSVELTVHGPHAQDGDPSNPERDLSLILERGAINTEVQK